MKFDHAPILGAPPKSRKTLLARCRIRQLERLEVSSKFCFDAKLREHLDNASLDKPLEGHYGEYNARFGGNAHGGKGLL